MGKGSAIGVTLTNFIPYECSFVLSSNLRLNRVFYILRFLQLFPVPNTDSLTWCV